MKKKILYLFTYSIASTQIEFKKKKLSQSTPHERKKSFLSFTYRRMCGSLTPSIPRLLSWEYWLVSFKINQSNKQPVLWQPPSQARD